MRPKHLLIALQFLTVLPIKIKTEMRERDFGASLVCFPLAGLFIGIVLSGINILLLFLNLSPLSVNIILVVALAVITGGIHLDGLSDTADAFLSGKPKDEMLVVMRDPHTGVMGVIAIVSVLLLKIGLLGSVAMELKATALILSCVLSRWAGVLVMFLFPYGRKQGKAGMFMQGMNLRIFTLSLAAVVVLAFAIWQLKGLLALLIAAGCAYLGGKFSVRKIGGITGDTIGAVIEATEAVTLFAVVVS